MKSILLLILLIGLFFVNNTTFSQSCDVEGQNCTGYWISGGIWTTNYDGCPIDIHYNYQICDGVTYFQISSLSFMDDDNDCDRYKDLLYPNGCCDPNQELLWRTWKKAFEEIIWIWFGLRHQQYPNQYICPQLYSYRTITPGGCASWRYASKSVSPYAELHRFIPVPCEENGCCIHEAKVCWDPILNQMSIIQTTTTTISQGDCGLLSPLYNPFAGYGPEWYVGPIQPCISSCYVWY